eukprot:842250-Rhodomonas_salina.1
MKMTRQTINEVTHFGKLGDRNMRHALMEQLFKRKISTASTEASRTLNQRGHSVVVDLQSVKLTTFFNQHSRYGKTLVVVVLVQATT